MEVATTRVANLIRPDQAVAVVLEVDTGRVVAVNDKDRETGTDMFNHGHLPAA